MQRTNITSAKHGVPLIRSVSIGPEVKGTGSSEVLDALSHAI